ncbi:Sec-independent protein translocase protein TatC [Phycisphaerales bacterium]|nr:Sec-independent protein translocase protein TatC [Phycisphaerales bacterium]
MPTHKANAAYMPLGDHLEELRRRIMFALIGLVPIALVAMGFGSYLLAFLVEPAKSALRKAGQPDLMIQTGPLEAFGTYMKVSLIAAVVVGSPWVFYQFWKFVAPGLYRHEKRFVYFLLPLSTVLTSVGLVFLFRIILPVILTWLVGFGTMLGAAPTKTGALPEGVVLPTVPVLAADPSEPALGEVWFNRSLMELRVCVNADASAREVRAVSMHREAGIVQQYRVSEYVSLLLTLTLAFAGAFQTPVVVLLLGWVGLVKPEMLNRFRRHAILVCAVLAAILMPGDPLSMVLMWLPLMGLYELGGILLRMFPAHRVSGKRNDEEGEG